MRVRQLKNGNLVVEDYAFNAVARAEIDGTKAIVIYRDKKYNKSQIEIALLSSYFCRTVVFNY